MGVDELIGPQRDVILRIVEKHGASNVRVFGSVARGEARPDSDVDLLIDAGGYERLVSRRPGGGSGSRSGAARRHRDRAWAAARPSAARAPRGGAGEDVSWHTSRSSVYHPVRWQPSTRTLLMSVTDDVRYVTDADGKPTAVLVPIDLWNEIASERETECLLRNPVMRQRLLAARDRTGGIPLEDAIAKLGL